VRHVLEILAVAESRETVKETGRERERKREGETVKETERERERKREGGRERQ
jgi:hypothetical protein